MPYPNEFYYSESHSNVSYGETPTGNLDVGRLIHGQPYWISPSLPREPKQKKLILADFSAFSWTEDKIKKVQVELKRLMDEGFAIYYWQGKEVISLKQDMLAGFFANGTFATINSAYPDEIIHAAVTQQRLIHDEIFILDDYWLRRIINVNLVEEERSLIGSDLGYSDFRHSEGKEEIAKIIDILTKSTPKLTQIIHNNFSSSTNPLINYLIKTFPELRVLRHYENVTFVSDEANQLAENGVINDLTLENMKTVKILSFGTFYGGNIDKINSHSLQTILNATDELEMLTLNDIKDFSGDLTLTTGCLRHLKYLRINDSRINLANFKNLLRAAPELEEISIETMDLSDKFTLDPKSLLQLKKIYIKDSLINSKSIQILLLASPNVEYLDLENKTFLTDLCLPPESLKCLKKIKLIRSDITYNNLQKMLAAAPNINSLDLSKCDDLFSEDWVHMPTIFNLETFVSMGNGINSSQLQKILTNAPRLRSIFLSDDKLSDDIELQPNSLEELEELSLTASSINNGSLQSLLLAAPMLKKLSLSPFINMTLTDVNFSKLEFISFSFQYDSNFDIQKVFTEALNLKKFTLVGFHFPVGGISIKENSLPCLEEIDLSYSTFTTADLKKILAAAPNLKKINLRSVRILPNGSVFDDDLINRLSHVKDVSLSKGHSAVAEKLLEITSRGANFSRKANESVPIDPLHNPAEAKNFTPPSTAENFQYQGINNTKNQGMIIEKLSQYLTLTKTHLPAIPKIKPGICNALTHYFVDSKPKDWDRFMDSISKWNGEKNTLTADLKSIFRGLYSYIGTYQLSSTFYDFIRTRLLGYKERYLGDNLPSFLANCKTPCVLSNPWHAIAIRPKADGVWVIYDPNYVGGYREVATQDLQKTIHDAIGKLVHVDSTNSKLVPKIDNSASFIEAGGLLVLCRSDNPKSLLAQLDKGNNYSKAALDGLLFRDNNGLPAWVLGIKNKAICAYTQTLLQQFINKNPVDYLGQLQRSIECLSPQEKQEVMTKITQYFPASDKQDIRETLVDAIRTIAPDKAIAHERFFATWSNTTPAFKTTLEYCQQIVGRGEVKKRLIKLSTTADVNAMRLALQKYAKDIHRPVFYINSPEDLVCSASFVERQGDNTGLLKKGPGGPLHDFLKASNAGDSPVLIVNYEHFHADDIVKFNSFIDKERRTDDGKALPEDAIVVGLININKPDCYQGADFYSRFDEVEVCPLSSETLALSPLSFIEKPSVSNNIINLYHALDWEERLLGRWVLNGDNLTFQEGELSKAIAKGGTIEIQNGLWDDEKFQCFWQEFKLSGHEDLQLIRNEGYAWDSLTANLEIKSGLAAGAIVLNPSRLSEFFNHYKCVGNKLVSEDGLIKSAANNVLKVNLTRSLSEDEWAMVLAACQEHGLSKLEVNYAPDVKFPEVLHPPMAEVSLSPIAEDHATQIIISTDTDTTIAAITKEDDTWTVIDVSECNASDLLRRINGKLIEDGVPRFHFEEPASMLKTALDAQKKIILKGEFSRELADELAPLLLARQIEKSRGTLLLVSQDSTPFNYFPIKSHTVEMSEKAALLEPLSKNVEKYLATESLSQLKARTQYIKNHHDSRAGDESWEGLSYLSGVISQMEPFDPLTSMAKTRAFTLERQTSVNSALAKEPYVFLAGLSGVGKTTFVAEELSLSDDTLYVGEENILKWINSESQGRKLLFIDEANLSPKKWSEFEGLFNTPPTILVKGVLHTLKPNHKVVFAGNPISYGDERKLAPFFQHHGNSVVFSPLPPAVVYEKTLKPLFANTLLKDSDAVISDHILKIYEFLCSCSTKDVLIYPRELQMIALLVSSYHQEKPTVDPMIITKHFAYQLTANLVPVDKRDEFDLIFKPAVKLPREDAKELTEFMITPSRQPLRNLVDDWISLREHRRSTSTTIRNPAQLYGGLGGIVIEGEAGIGKSELVIATLVARGYRKDHDFYSMPVSMPLSEKEALLRKAFDEGAVVVIDEINSSPMMERLLNSLLMGKTPENKSPTNPGFMVIGTQNPVTFAGRRAPSTALARRLTAVELPPYSLDEIRTILIARGMRASDTLSLAQAFIKQVNYAKQNHLTPAPTFRDLLKRADAVMKGHVLASTPLETTEISLSEKKEICLVLLESINISRFDGDDKEMDDFLKDNRIKIEQAGVLAIDHLKIKLTEIKRKLCGDGSDKKTQLQEIKAIISRFEKKSHSFFSIGMKAKANKIEAAMKLVPIEERIDIFTGTSQGAKASREALAAHRHLGRQGYVYKKGDDIDEAKAAASYTEIKSKFSK